MVSLNRHNSRERNDHLMRTEIRRAIPEDYEELIRFANEVFGLSFPALLPKLYDGRPETAGYHYIVTEDARIKAAAGSFPLRLHLGGGTLDVRGIGTVSVHPDSRGKGYMKQLMARAVADARAEGADLMCLGGQRQRYEYFGFGMASTDAVFTVTPTNRRHRRNVATGGIELVPLTEDSPHLNYCVRLHDGLLVHAARPADRFAEILRSWDCTPYVILADGAPAGYASVSNKKQFPRGVQELVLEDGADCMRIILRIVEFCEGPTEFHPAWTQKPLYDALTQVAESASICQGEMLHVLRYPRVLEACLRLQNDLCDGELVLAAEDGGQREAFEIRVEQGTGTVKCSRTDRTPEIVLPHQEMINRLFAPSGLIRPRGAADRNWFPIALFLPQADMC